MGERERGEGHTGKKEDRAVVVSKLTHFYILTLSVPSAFASNALLLPFCLFYIFCHFW